MEPYNVEICVDLNPILYENRGDFRDLVTAVDREKKHGFLSAVNCSHGVINVCWRFCVSYVILIVYSRFKCEEFLIKKKTVSRSAVSVVSSPKKKCWSLKYFGQVWGIIYFSHCRERQLKIVFEDVSHWGRAYIPVFSHLSCRTLQIPFYRFADIYNKLLCSSSAWFSTLMTVLRCTKFLKSAQNVVHRWSQELKILWVCVCTLDYYFSWSRKAAN